MSRRHNLRRIGKRRTYTADELAALLKVNILTVRRWCQLGLKPIERRRPFLFLGEDVARFLEARSQPRQPLAPGEFYCAPCKTKRFPLDHVVRLIPRAPTNVDFNGACPVCRRPLFRRVRIAEIGYKLGPCRVAREDEATPVRSAGDSLQTAPFEELSA